MNNAKLEALLLGARPLSHAQYSPMTLRVMEHITKQAALSKHINTARVTNKERVFIWLRSLHGVGLAIAIVTAIALFGGVAYASVRFVPDLIRLFNKGQNSIGRVEYSVPAFKNCYDKGDITLDKFEVSPNARLSDKDVEKTLRAKCEMIGMSKFANDTWPTYASHAKWQDGDTIFYTRPDLMGTVEKIDKHGVTLRENGGNIKTYPLFGGKSPEVYSHGERISGNAIKPGDYVYALVRVSEIYHASPPAQPVGEGSVIAQQGQGQPAEKGLVAVVKLSQPERYYNAMQQYVTEVIPCQGNLDERCSNAPSGFGIEVFPRLGEGGRPMDAFAKRSATVHRIINGTVTAINDNTITIKAGSGTSYSVGIGKTEIADYNSTIPAEYAQYVNDSTALRVQTGSWLEVFYIQTTRENRWRIANQDIVSVTLITDQVINKK